MINDEVIGLIRKILEANTVRNKLEAVCGFDTEKATLELLKLFNNKGE